LELIDLMLVSAFSNACLSFFSNKLMLQASRQAGKGKKASQTTEKCAASHRRRSFTYLVPNSARLGSTVVDKSPSILVICAELINRYDSSFSKQGMA